MALDTTTTKPEFTRFSRGKTAIERVFAGITKDTNGRRRIHLNAGTPCSFSKRRLEAAMEYADMSIEKARSLSGGCAILPVVRIRALEPHRPQPVLLSAQAIVFGAKAFKS